MEKEVRLLWLCLFFSIAMMSKAQTFVVDGIYYSVKSKQEVSVSCSTWGHYIEVSNLVIPSEVTYNGRAYSVTSIDDSAFGLYGESYTFTSVVIPESVVSIGDFAFANCKNIVSISLPDSMEYIGEGAFHSCNSLITLAIPSNVKCIEDDAFSYCSSLASITIPNSVEDIGKRSFAYCSSLDSIVIPNSVTSIGEEAFRGCGSLMSITFPKNVTFIGGQAFAGTLWYDVQPEGLVYIGKVAYRYKEESLENVCISIKDGTISVSPYAFSSCTDITAVSIPNGLKYIGNKAFEGCNGFTFITLPDGVISIGEQAFKRCSNLETVVIPESLVSIGREAFDGCVSLSFVYANNIESWCRVDFANPTANPLYYSKKLYMKGAPVQELYIPDSATMIGTNAFYCCDSLTSIIIPKSVINIGDNAFYGCNRLSEVVNFSDLDIQGGSKEHGYVGYYAQKVVETDNLVGEYCFYTSEESRHYLRHYIGNETVLTLPKDYNGDDYVVDSVAFINDDSITSVEIPQTVGTVGKSAFSGCDNLATVRLARGVMTIEDNAFENCTRLNAIVIPQNFSTIGNKSFAGCDSLASVEFKESVETIGNNAFENCTSLATLIFPESLTAIGDEAFKGCSGLKTILFSENIDAYGSNVFEGCDAVETMTVKGSVMPTVPSDKITSITLYSPVPLETAEFANKVYRNATVYVPQGSLERYQAASVWKNFWTIKEFDPTGIEQLTIDNGQLIIYDLSGRKVMDTDNLKGGIYIINGRKVVIND